MRLRLSEGSQEARAYSFRPPDPTWASPTLMAEVRAALTRFDPHIGIWWSMHRRAQSDEERPGRWRVMEWLQRQKQWSTAFYWEGPRGEYRDPWPAGAITHKLGTILVNMAEQQRRVETDTEKAAASRKAELYDGLNQWAQDFSERASGRKQTFLLDAIGRPRQRGGAFRTVEETPQLSNHERWLVDYFKRHAR